MSRYIDADALHDQMLSRHTQYYNSTDACIAVQACMVDVETAPTADVVPVVHSHWTRLTEGLYRCANCISLSEEYGDYCPWCGAKMDGERKDGERKDDEQIH